MFAVCLFCLPHKAFFFYQKVRFEGRDPLDINVDLQGLQFQQELLFFFVDILSFYRYHIKQVFLVVYSLEKHVDGFVKIEYQFIFYDFIEFIQFII